MPSLEGRIPPPARRLTACGALRHAGRMSAVLIAVAAFVAYLAAYYTYGRRVASRLLGF